MLRLLNFAAVVGLIGSALYAYHIKYDTIWYVEAVVKLKHEIQREHDVIDVMRADWAYVTRPERVQALAEKAGLELQPLALAQIVRAGDLPEKAAKVDTIGRKLEALGLAEPTNTPTVAKGGAVTPSTLQRKP